MLLQKLHWPASPDPLYSGKANTCLLPFFLNFSSKLLMMMIISRLSLSQCSLGKQNTNQNLTASRHAIKCSVHKIHQTCLTFPMARPKCLMRDFTNLKRIYQPIRQMSDEPWKFFHYTASVLIKISNMKREHIRASHPNFYPTRTFHYTASEISVWASESELGRNQNKWIDVSCLHWSESVSETFTSDVRVWARRYM